MAWAAPIIHLGNSKHLDSNPKPQNGKQESSKYTAKNGRTKIVARCAPILNTYVVVLAPKLWAARFNSYEMSTEASGNRYKYCDFTVTLLPKVPGSSWNALTKTQVRHKLYLPSTTNGLSEKRPLTIRLQWKSQYRDLFWILHSWTALAMWLKTRPFYIQPSEAELF